MKKLLLLRFPSNSPRVVSKYDSLDLFSPSFMKNILRKEINAVIFLTCRLQLEKKRKGHIARLLTL